MLHSQKGMLHSPRMLHSQKVKKKTQGLRETKQTLANSTLPSSASSVLYACMVKTTLSPLFGEMSSISLMNDGYNGLELWCRTSLRTLLPISFCHGSLPYRVSMFLSPFGCRVFDCDTSKFIPWLVVAGDLCGQEVKKVSETLDEKTVKLIIV